MAIDELKATRKDIKQLLMACATLDRMYKKLEERILEHEALASDSIPILRALVDRVTAIEETLKMHS